MAKNDVKFTPKEISKIVDSRIEFNRQYCSYCGHSLIFNPKEPTKICSWCKRENKNNTKGRFNYIMYKMLNQDYKVVKIEEDKK